MYKKYSKKNLMTKLRKQTISKFEKVAANDPVSGLYWREIKNSDKKFMPNIDPTGDMSDYDVKVMIKIYHDIYLHALKDIRSNPKKRIKLIDKLTLF